MSRPRPAKVAAKSSSSAKKETKIEPDPNLIDNTKYDIHWTRRSNELKREKLNKRDDW
jgi:hypothetical protein